jgi:ABC-type Mn2+/Zn2+ transport system permease subunit
METAVIYLVLGLLPLRLQEAVPADFDEPLRRPRRASSVRLWDFLFYASFGFVVTRSVAIAGVLLVFCYLIVPSVGAMLLRADRTRLRHRLAHGVVVSILGCISRPLSTCRPARRLSARSVGPDLDGPSPALGGAARFVDRRA